MSRYLKCLFIGLMICAGMTWHVCAKEAVTDEAAVRTEDDGFADSRESAVPDESAADAYCLPSANESELPLAHYESSAQNACGANAVYTLSEDGILTISGTGAIADYGSSTGSAPWYSERASITGVVINEGITAVGVQAFAQCYNIQTVSFPSTLTTIGEAAFFGCSRLNNVVLPDSLASLDTAAFADCTSLSDITFGSGLKKIGTYAFQQAAFTAFAIPDGVTEVGMYPFYGAKLKSLHIPASVTSLDNIGHGAFDLAGITVDSANTSYRMIDGALCSYDGSILYTYPAGNPAAVYTIPSTVVKLESNAFSNALHLTTVNIGTQVTTIGDWVFYGSGLKQAVIPDSVTSLGYGPFDQCKSLQTAVIGAGIKETPYRMFQDCTSLVSVTFKEGLEVVGMRCMMNCNNITTVTLPSTVKRIEGFAFYNCKNLEYVQVPAGVTYISGDAFYGSNKALFEPPATLTLMEDGTYCILYNLQVSGSYYYDKAYEVVAQVNAERAKAGLGALTMDMDLLDAAMKRAAECCLDFSHTRPNGMDCFSVSDKASGENIAAGNSTAAATMNQWMNSAGHRANILTSGFTTIGVGCFSQGGTYFWVQLFGTGSAATGTQPNNKDVSVKIQVLPEHSLEFYYPYDNLRIMQGKTEQIKAAVINAGWDYVYAVLDGESFNWSVSNTKYAKVDENGVITGLSPGVATVSYALKENPSLGLTGRFTVVKAEATAHETGDTLEDTENNAAYEVTETGKKKGDSVTGAEVAYKGSLKTGSTVTIPATVTIDGVTYKVTSIAAKAFKNNKKLKVLKIGKNVKTIGSSAFYGCIKLTTVTMGKNVTTIGKQAFYGCSKLKTVTMGTNLTTIGKQAFYKCTALTKITIPSKVTKLDSQCFYGCKKLKTITVKSSKLKTVGTNAIKGIHKKAVIKVPSKKLKAYKKLFGKKTGYVKTMKIKK